MKTIQIHSTPRAGSTLLGLMLAYRRDEKGICTGDLYHAFNPHTPIKREHNPADGLSCYCDIAKNPDKNPGSFLMDRYLWSEVRRNKDACQIWRRVYENGMTRVYDTLEEMGFELAVASSKKEPYYELMCKGWPDTQHVVIYKHPYDFAYSNWKRDSFSVGKQRTYIKIYKKIFELLDDPSIVGYKQLAQSPQKTLAGLCKELGIEYFEGKERFWNNPTPHIHSGAMSSLVHLVPVDSQAYEKMMWMYRSTDHSQDPSLDANNHRTIYYANSKSKLPEDIKTKVREETDSFVMYKRLGERAITKPDGFRWDPNIK